MKIVCCRCGSSRDVKSDRVPPGWKRIEDGPICRSCLTAGYVLRAITMPVAYPVDRTSKDLWAEMKKCWRMSTELSNWTVAELAKLDHVRSASDEKLPSFSGRYLYPDARKRCPDMNPQSVTALLRSVEQRYRKRRYEVVWLSSASLPRYRYPAPYPIHNQGWTLRAEHDGIYEIDLRINGERWTLRLAGGHGFWRQQRSMDIIVSGKALKGELSFLCRKEGSSRRIMAKMVSWLPRIQKPDRPRDGAIELFTRNDCFLDALYPRQQNPWRINADQVRAWIVGHQRMLERIGQDKRVTSRKWRLAELERRCLKQSNRLRSFCQMSAAAVAQLAVRAGAASVVYNDAERSYMPSFPWAMLREYLGNKLNELGIDLVIASAAATPEVREALETEDIV